MGMMRGIQLGGVVAGVMVTLAMAAAKGAEGREADPVVPHVEAATPEEAGRYLVIVGGCNDCHTPGWGESDGTMPESDWLTGSSVGFSGPWGTSYPANLRLTVQATSEQAFVARMRAGAGMPPMPWMNTMHMSEGDVRALYRYIRSLGPAGERAPAPLPPGVAPSTPYIPFVPVSPSGGGS